jgi:hypothetical protein
MLEMRHDHPFKEPRFPVGRTLLPLAVRTGLLAVLVLAAVAPLAAQNSSSSEAPPLRIEKGFLKSAKFVYRGGEPQKVSGWFSYSPEFLELLGTHPAALDEVNRAKPYNVTALVGSVGMVAVSAKILIETINDANDVSEGTIDSDTGSTSWTDVGLLAGFGALSVFSLWKANSHVNRAVDIFNEAEGYRPGGMPGPALRLGLRSVDGRRAVALGISVSMR